VQPRSGGRCVDPWRRACGTNSDQADGSREHGKSAYEWGTQLSSLLSACLTLIGPLTIVAALLRPLSRPVPPLSLGANAEEAGPERPTSSNRCEPLLVPVVVSEIDPDDLAGPSGAAIAAIRHVEISVGSKSHTGREVQAGGHRIPAARLVQPND